MTDIVNGSGVKVIREGLYITGLKAEVFRPSPLPGEINTGSTINNARI